MESSEKLEEGKDTQVEFSVLRSLKVPTDPGSYLIYNVATGSFFVVNPNSGSIFLFDSSAEVLFGPISVTDQNDNLVVRSFQHETVFCSSQAVGIRRDIGGAILLQTALKPLLNVSPTSQVLLELSNAEAQKLKEYLKDGTAKFGPKSEAVLAQLFEFFNDDEETESKWKTHVIRGKFEDLSDLLKEITEEEVKKSSCILPLASAIRERLDLMLPQPYNLEIGLDTLGEGFDKTVMASEVARRTTFARWPHMHYRWALPEQMAEAGFFHQPNSTGDDRVNCFACKVCLVCWEPADEPWSEHERHSPGCSFVRGEMTPNIPMAMSQASVPPAPHHMDGKLGSIGASFSSDWVPIAFENGAIQLWHLTALPKEPVNFSVDMNDHYVGMKTGFVRMQPRKSNRVTFSDDSGENSAAIVAEALAEVITESINAYGVGESQSVDAADETKVRVNALCCAGGKLIGSNGASRSKLNLPESRCSDALIVGLELEESKLVPQPKRSSPPNANPVVEAMNSVNSGVEIILPGPEESTGRRYHPFVLVYKIDEAPMESRGDAEGGKVAGGKRKSRVWSESKDAANFQGGIVYPSSVPVYQNTFDEDESSPGVSMDEELNVALSDWTADLDPANNNPGLIDSLLNASATLEEQPTDKAVATSTADFSPLLKVSYQAPTAQPIVLQCFRLPPQLDAPDWSFQSIQGTTNGTAVVMVLTRSAASAVVVYRLSFTGMMTGLSEQASRMFVRAGKIKDVVLLPGDVLGLESNDPDTQDCIVSVMDDGSVVVLNLDTGATIKEMKPKKYSSIARGAGDKICLMTTDGEVDLFQADPGLRLEDSFENSIFDLDSCALVEGIDLSEVPLMELWELTKSDRASTASFSCEPPPYWSEIHQHQRLRKNPQHYLKEERQARSWQLSPNGNSWKEQLVEITLPSKVSASHIDVHFDLHQLCHGIPDIEVTLFSKLFVTQESGSKHGRNDLEAVFGPVMLADSLDLSLNSGLIQMSHPVLQSKKHKKFIIRFRCLTEESESQRLWKHSQQEFIQSTRELYEKAQQMAYVQEQTRVATKYGLGVVKEQQKAPLPVLRSFDGKKPMVEKKGCDWIQEIAITVWKTKTTFTPKARLYRAALIGNQNFHGFLLGNLIPIDRALESPSRYFQLMAFDICSWLLAHWHIGKGPSILAAFTKKLMQKMEQLLRCCYADSSRNVAHKCSAFFASLFASLKRQDVDLFHSLASCILLEVKGLLGSLPEFRSAGSLCWFMSLTSFLIRSEPAMELSAEVVSNCVDTLRRLSDHIDLNDPALELLKSRYGISALPNELELFECAPPVLQLVQKPLGPQQSTYTYANVVSSGISTSAHFVHSLGQDEVDWGELLDFHPDDAEDPLEANCLYKVSVGFSRPKTSVKRKLLSREHAAGLLDVEPLAFSCAAGSDGLRVENADSGNVASVFSDSVSGSCGKGPIPLPEVAQTDAAPSGNPSVANAVSSMKQQVQTILSKQMQWFALQQQKQKLQGKLQEHAAAALSNPVDVSVTPGTQGSSASTFGVPTTPKTTPFMTPTPLSPMHLSPFNSEANLNMPSDEEDDSMSNVFGATETSLPAHLMSLDTLKPPQNQILIVDRMNSGGRKFVVLDFGRPILLTDVLIPSCGDLNSISVDVWVNGENVDGQRLLVSNDIAEKNLIAIDLDPPPLCRYLKMTYIGRQGLGNSCSCRISLGNFYGHRFIVPWQLAYSADELTEAERLAILQSPVSRRHLEQLSEDLRCKHQLSARRLRQQLEDGTDDLAVRDEYKECYQFKLQWNLVQRVLWKLGMEDANSRPHDWDECSLSQIRTSADVLLSCVIRCAPYLNIVESSTLRSPKTLLQLDSAVLFFEKFCVHQNAKLQTLCCVWLYQYGCGTPWWGKFIGRLLESFLARGAAEKSNSSEKTFLLISFLTAHSIRSGNTQVMADLLSLLLRILAPSEAEGVDLTLLSWTLYLLSIGFDVVINSGSSHRKRADRWGFLTKSQDSSEWASADKDSSKRSSSSRKIPKLKWSDSTGGMSVALSLMEQQYNKQVEVTEDLKKYIGEYSLGKEAKSSKAKKSKESSLSGSKSKPSSSSKRSKTSRKRSRSSVKLRLPSKLSLEVAQKLSKLLIENSALLNPSSTLTLIKVLSKICAYSSAKYIPLSQFLELDGIEKLVQIGLYSARSPWAQHAVICFLLDILDAENKAYIGSLKEQQRSEAHEGNYPVMFPQFPLTSTLAPSAGASSSTTPDTPTSAQLAIDSILASIKPNAIANSSLPMELRSEFLQALGRELIYSNLSAGYPFAQINVWVASAKDYENSIAIAAKSEKQYRDDMQKLVQQKNNKLSGVFDPNGSIITLSQQLHFSPQWSSMGGYTVPSPIPPPSSYAIAGPPPPLPPWLSVAGQTPPGGLAEAKEKLSKLCEQLQMSSPMVSYASGPPPPGFTTVSSPVDMPAHEQTPGAEDPSASGESGANSPFPIDLDDALQTDSASASDRQFSLPRISRIQLDQETENKLLCLGIDLHRNLTQQQVLSLVVEERVESQPHWSASINCSRWLLEDETLVRTAIHSMLPLKKPIPLSRDETLAPVLETTSAELVSQVLSAYFTAITPYSSGEHVESLLHFLWGLLTGSLPESSRSKPTDPTYQKGVKLSVEAVQTLLRYLAHSSDLMNRSWTLAIRILTSLAGIKENGVAIGVKMVESPEFAVFLERYVVEGGSAGTTTAGPAVSEALSGFLNRLRIHCDIPGKDTGNTLKRIVFDVLIAVCRQASKNVAGRFPCAIDLLSNIVEFLLGQDFSALPPQVLGEFLVVTAQVARRYLAISNPVTTPSLLSGIVNPRYCFQMGVQECFGTEFRSFSDRSDVVLCNMLKLCSEFNPDDFALFPVDITPTPSSAKPTFAKCNFAQLDSSAIDRCVLELLRALSYCCARSSAAKKTDCGMLSVADWVFTLLKKICGGKFNEEVWMKALVGFIGDPLRTLNLSFPLVAFLLDVLGQENELAAFLKFGGGNVMIDQIKSAMGSALSDSKAYQGDLIKKLASVSTQVLGANSSGGAKKSSDPKIEGMTNFSPSCQISSTSPMAHHLSALLTSTPPHRRARTAAWTYHFYPAELWLDLTLTLPHPVLLKEIQIRPHLPSLQTGPSAVQIELASDYNTGSFTLLGPPVVTTGCSKIRIPTDSYYSLVTMVKIHVKRPPDSTNMGMSQIMLLGHSPLSNSAAVSGDLEGGPQLGHWIEILRNLLEKPGSEALKKSIEKALVPRLVDVFMFRSMGYALTSSLKNLLLLMDSKCEAESDILVLILDYIESGKAVLNTTIPWLVDLLDTLCTDTELERIKHLMRKVAYLTRSRMDEKQSDSEEVLASLLVLCASVLWKIPELSSELNALLIDLARNLDELLNTILPVQSSLAKGAGWLLCSVGKHLPSEIDRVLQLVKFDEEDEEIENLWLLGSALQSAPAATRLVENGVVPSLFSRFILLLGKTACSVSEKRQIEALCGFFATVTEVDPIKDWLISPSGQESFRQLMSLVCASQLRKMGVTTAGVTESGFIRMVRNLLPSRSDHQDMFCLMLCESLDKLGLEGLNGALQEITLCTLLEDETITIVRIDEAELADPEELARFQKKLLVQHPMFGCSLRRKVLKVSMFGKIASLLQETKVGKVVRKPARTMVTSSGDVAEGGWPPAPPNNPLFANVPWAYAFQQPQFMSKSPKLARIKEEKTGGEAIVTFASIEPKTALPGNLTFGQAFAAQKGVLQISIQAKAPFNVPPTAEELLNTVGPTSTLEVFAKKGGLAILAQHLQLYQPTTGDLRSKSNEKEALLMEQQNGKQMLTAYAESFDPSYDPFEFIDMTASSVGLGTAAVPPAVDVEGRKEKMRAILNSGLAPHIVVSFSIFLRLHGYAELLISENRERAQRLLRLAMGATPDSGTIVNGATDYATLALLPFSTLTSLYEKHSWEKSEGKSIRHSSVELGIPELLLVCLSAFSHQEPRQAHQTRQFADAVRLVEQLLPAKEKSPPAGSESNTLPPPQPPTSTGDRGSQYWAKGTGFGTGSTQQQWNVDLHVVKRKQDEENVTCLLNVLAAFIYPGIACLTECDQESPLPSDTVSQELLDLLKRSCAIPALISYLRNDSVLDIARHTSVYEGVLRLLSAFALAPPLGSLLEEVVEGEALSLGIMLKKLNDCIQVYASKLKPITNLSEKMSEEEESPEGNTEAQELKAEEGLLKLVPLVEKASQLCLKCIGDHLTMEERKRKDDSVSESMTMENRYMDAMRDMQFDSVNFFTENGSMLMGFHYESSVRGSKDSGALAPRVRRLAQEAVTLSTSLPLNASSSVFVRAAEERLDVMKVLITGPADTPYCNGCFEFDVWFPPEYPSSPMHINLSTTGGGAVRFNPNLYNDGKVCLSVLNTWHGRPEERWNPHNSSFLQVLVSIQSLILVPEPYFNEPGYERSRNTPAGQQASREYDANLRQATVRWAMLEMLRSPPLCFKDVIQRHFWLKKDEISAQIQGWIAEMEEQSSQATGKQASRTISANLTFLKRYYHQLSEEFKKMQCPKGLEETEPSASSVAMEKSVM